jgi:hypothetical protein
MTAARQSDFYFGFKVAKFTLSIGGPDHDPMAKFAFDSGRRLDAKSNGWHSKAKINFLVCQDLAASGRP